MALLVLFSTMSFTVEMHYCGNKLVDFSLFNNLDRCKTMPEKTESDAMCPSMKMAMECCKDVQIAQLGQHELKISFDQITFDPLSFIASFFNAYKNLLEGHDQNIVPFNDYSPPPLIRDIHILDQSFLI